MIQKPNLSFWKLWNLSFGFFGVQIAYALQSANISRIFATLGADPHNLNWNFERQDMVSFRSSHPLSFCRCHCGGACYVPFAQCGFVRYGCWHGYDIRSYLAYVSRHKH